MEPLEYVMLASAAMNLLEKLVPQIRDAIKGGTLTAEQEAEARAVYERMRSSTDLYSGPEYELSGR